MSEPEWKTRRDRIDTRLRELGWEVQQYARDSRPAGLTAHAVLAAVDVHDELTAGFRHRLRGGEIQPIRADLGDSHAPAIDV